MYSFCHGHQRVKYIHFVLRSYGLNVYIMIGCIAGTDLISKQVFWEFQSGMFVHECLLVLMNVIL